MLLRKNHPGRHFCETFFLHSCGTTLTSVRHSSKTIVRGHYFVGSSFGRDEQRTLLQDTLRRHSCRAFFHILVGCLCQALWEDTFRCRSCKTHVWKFLCGCCWLSLVEYARHQWWHAVMVGNLQTRFVNSYLGTSERTFEPSCLCCWCHCALQTIHIAMLSWCSL